MNLNLVGTGADLTIGGLTAFNSANITVSGGGSLSLPGVTSYTGNDVHDHARGHRHGQHADPGQPGDRDGSVQRLPGRDRFEALAGGTVTLSSLKTINTGTVVLESDGTGSVLNVPALTSFTETGG